MKYLLQVLFLLVLNGYGFCQERLQEFPLTAVQLLESPFYRAQNTDLEYILEMDVDRLLAPYLIDAGLEPKAPRYGNWENTGLDGHIGGHYLSALSMMYASTGNPEMKRRMDYMIDELWKCQQKNGNGYIGGVPNGKEVWDAIQQGNINAGNFSLNDRWVPLYNIHKIYAGLRDAYLHGGSDKARVMLIALTDWMIDITRDLSEEQLQEMLRSEHGGLNEVFADVADLTDDEKYLQLAKRFSHQQILSPLLQGDDELTGMHANTQIPKVIGYERVAEINEDQDWSDAASFFWETVTENRSVSIGGNSVREHFNPIDDFSNMIASNQGPETCNTYNMLRLTKMLFLGNPDRKYTDYFERALYSHILSTQHPDGGFVYFTPMRPQHYRVYSQPHESFWCCVGSGLENHAKYGELIYAHTNEDLYLNLFIPSALNWEEKQVEINQVTAFPYEESSTLEIQVEKPTVFGLKIRKPSWLTEGGFSISINGEMQTLAPAENGYVSVTRTWNNGDNVTMELPMKLQMERLPDGSPWASFIYGPMVLAAVTDSTNLPGMWADDSRMGHVAAGDFYPLDEAPMIVVNNNADALSGVKPVPGEPLSFNLSDVVYPEKYNDLKLVPFYQIHEARYVMYWSLIAEENLDAKLEALKKKEKEMLALEAITVDQVATGEQQPETEHYFQGERTWTGNTRGAFWRSGRGWFSYDLDNPAKSARTIRITYFGGNEDKNFDILLNDEFLATVEMNESTSDDFYTVDYIIPNFILNNDGFTIRFEAKGDDSIAEIYYIRLLDR